MMFAFESVVPVACAAALFASLLSMTAAAQEPGDADGRALLQSLDRHRLPAARLAEATLSIDGTYGVSMGGKQVAKGTFRERFVGDDLVRHTSDMGPFGKMERGVFRDVAWEVDPSMGAKVHRGVHDAVVRRYFAWLRGAPLAGRYERAERMGAEQLDGHDCTIWKLSPKNGPADLVHVDAAGTVHRLDIALPTPESADATWNLDDAMLAQITFSDWTDVGDLRLPRQRVLRMGPAVVSFTCTEMTAGEPIPVEEFAPPVAIEKAKAKAPAGPAFDADGKPIYQIDEREPQPMASIRMQCKATEIGKALATMLPEITAHLSAVGGQAAGAPFTIYHGFGADGTMVDLEAGIPVRAKVTEKGRVKNGTLPGGRTLTAWHVGSYEGLGAAHEALQQHVVEAGHTTRGPVWEVYWTDPGMVPDPAQWKTQLFQPIE